MKKLVISLIVVLAILIGVSHVYAQGAWVCWHKIETFYYGQRDTKFEWEIMEAFPQYDQCMRTIPLYLAEWEEKKAYADGTHIRVRGGVDKGYIMIFVFDPDTLKLYDMTHTFYCYPESVDPRKR